jgi:hypothetical protein
LGRGARLGPRPPTPPGEYRMRLAIELWQHKVARDVCCDEAAAVLKEYAERGSTLYNACQGE